jgi:hypothetical protein
MTKTPKPPPRYTEKTLIRIIQDCYDLDDLTNLCNNLRDLEENKDLEITSKMQMEVKIQQQVIIFGGKFLGRNKN